MAKTDKALKHMTEGQLTKALWQGKITRGQHDKRMKEISTARRAQEFRANPLRRYYETGVLPGAKKRRATRRK